MKFCLYLPPNSKPRSRRCWASRLHLMKTENGNGVVAEVAVDVTEVAAEEMAEVAAEETAVLAVEETAVVLAVDGVEDAVAMTAACKNNAAAIVKCFRYPLCTLCFTGTLIH